VKKPGIARLFIGRIQFARATGHAHLFVNDAAINNSTEVSIQYKLQGTYRIDIDILMCTDELSVLKSAHRWKKNPRNHRGDVL
jgi:hypothetical protein